MLSQKALSKWDYKRHNNSERKRNPGYPQTTKYSHQLPSIADQSELPTVSSYSIIETISIVIDRNILREEKIGPSVLATEETTNDTATKVYAEFKRYS